MRHFLLLFCLLIWGCASSPQKPSEPLADSTLVAILVEFQLAQARQQLDSDLPPAYRDSILAHYNTSPELFAQWMHYLSQNIEQFKPIQEAVLDTLEHASMRLESQRPF